MKKYFKSLISCMLVATMLLSNISVAFAQQLPVDDVELSDSVQVNSEDEISDDNSDDSQQEVSDVQEEEINDNPTEEVSIIDFSATEYCFKEGNDTVNVTIRRYGDTSIETAVSFKAADLISTYGEDYVILDADGNPFEKVSGIKPDISDFSYSENPYDENADGLTYDFSTEGEAENEDIDSGNEDTETAYTKATKSTGSKLLDAQAAYLNMDTFATEDTVAAEETKEVLENVYEYLFTAEGADGYIDFLPGETEKDIVIKILDNQKAEKDKIFLLALIDSSAENTKVSASATTYVTIADDEKYETPYITLSCDDNVLTKDKTESYVTLRRESGTEYFNVVYLSTVKGSASEDAYLNMDMQAVAFVPGEREKQVKIEAYDFSRDGNFGVRLESDDKAEIGNYYVDVEILGENQAEENKSEENAIALLSADVTLGEAVTELKLKDFPGGWKDDITNKKTNGSSKWVENDDLMLHEKKSNGGRAWTTNGTKNLTGCKSIDFYMNVGGSANNFITYFEIDSERKWSGSVEGYSIEGQTDDWRKYTLYVGPHNDSYYFQFSTKTIPGIFNNPKAYLGNPVTFHWAKYSVSTADSIETFNRKVYDFIEGSPNRYDIYYDNYENIPKTLAYDPGTIAITSGGSNIGAFYASNTNIATIESVNAKENEKNGIYLKEVRVVSSEFDKYDVYDFDAKQYRNKNVYVMKADPTTHKVTFTPDCAFVKALMNAGVLDGNNSLDSSIVFYPVYAQEMVTVNFENADNDGVFNEESKGSYINNIFGLENKTSVDTSRNNLTTQYYTITVPKYSVIRMQMSPLSDRTPYGFLYWTNGNPGGGQITYYKEGETIHTGGNETGKTVLEETDTSKGEFVAHTNMWVKPVTDKQSFYVGYSPLAYDSRPVDDLTGLVYDSNISIDEETETVDGDYTNSEGYMWLSDPFLGKSYTIKALVPENYYASWKNMTGDTNNNGTIGDDGDEYSDKDLNTLNPDEVIGNILPITLDQNNTRYQYYFAPKSVSATVTRKGRVVREKRTLFDIKTKGDNVKNVETEPVVAASVNIGGNVAQTDGNGEYELDIKLPSPWGYMGAGITVGDTQYNRVISLVNYESEIRLKALEMFALKSMSAGYVSQDTPAGDRREIAFEQNAVDVENKEFTVTIKLEDISSIQATNARFYIYDKHGYQKIDCNEEDGYVTTVEKNGSVLTAEIKFNPKRDIQAGDRLYVQFADQNDLWYNPIDTGYNFIVPLQLDTFALGLMGSTSLENMMKSNFVVDVLGDPLGDVDLGTIPGFEKPVSTIYSPPNIPESEKDAYTWYMSDYSFGADFLFKGMNVPTANSNYENDMKNYLYDVLNAKEGGKEPVKSKYKTIGLFSWNLSPRVGFNLRLSSRGDKYYFEDLQLGVSINAKVNAQQRFRLCPGLGILLKFNLNAEVAGVYHMYTEYPDDYQTNGAVLYDPETFGMFKEMDNVRREGYLFINPSISVNASFKITIVGVGLTGRFDTDMDFKFTESNSYAYGDIYIALDFEVNVLAFSVYTKEIAGETFKLFNTEGQNEHIEFDSSSYMSLMSTALEDDSIAETSVTKTISRDYLEERTPWRSGDEMVLMRAIDVESATTETELLRGVPKQMYMKNVQLSNGNIFSVFIDDAIERSGKNYGRLMWTYYNGTSWAQPQALCDDGTYDAFPEVVKMGDDKVMVAWSSVGIVMDESHDLQDALENLDIQTRIFDVSGDVPIPSGDAVTLTKPDGYGDVLPKLTYMSEENQVVAYYTKMEFDNITAETISNAFTADSAIMYLVYDADSDTWSNSGDAYSDDELDGMTDDEKAAFREEWYGQRFVYLNANNSVAPAVMDIDTASYNDRYSIITWVVDWDKNLETTFDRDIFMQYHDTLEHETTDIIKISNESMYYSSPELVSSGTNLYLFFGQMKEGHEEGTIRYHNLSEILQDEMYTYTESENGNYYELRYTIPEDTHTDRLGNEYTIPATEVVLEGDIATTSASISEYDAFIDKQGRMFVFWSGEEDGANHIYMVMYAGDNDTETEGNWSEKFSIVSSDDSYYSEIAGALYDGKVVIKTNKTNMDSDIRSLTFVKHVPYSDIHIKELELSDKAPRANRSVEVTASVINDGIMPYDEPVTVVFALNGEVVDEKTIDYKIFGSQVHRISTNIIMPDDIENAEISAYINGQNAVTVKPEFIGIPEFLNQEIATDEDGSKSYKVTLYNSGNIPSEEMLMTAYIGDEVIACETVESIASGESMDAVMPLDIKDSMYNITNGKGTADVVIRTTDKDEKAIDLYSEQAIKVFDAEATELLKKVEDVVFKYDTYTMKKGTHKDIQPEIIGVEEGLHVMWLESSNENVAKISNNIISATSPGKTTLKGVVVPDKQIAVFDAAGNGYMKNVLDTIPENLIKTVTVDIQVNSGSSGGSSGSSVSTKTEKNEDGSTTKTTTDKKTGTVTEVTTYPDGDVVTVKTEKDGTVTAEVKANSEKDVVLPIEPTADIIVVSFTDENGRTRYTDEFTESDEGIAVTANGNVKISVIQSERALYTDVHNNNHWAAKSVDFVGALGIMKGIGDDKFAPDSHLTRAMLVTMLYRADGEPEVETVNSFGDIEDNAWYEKAVLWAKQNGIVNGVTETEFSPDSDITREQIATIMHRYAKYKGDDVESGKNTNILFYNDSDSISDYAKASLQWANGIGLINGKTESTLNPLDNATRAEAATIFYRFVKANLISTQN